MKRLCIYMTYNKENRIYPYMACVIKSLKQCCASLYLVCNYGQIRSGGELISSYVDRILYRENRGFDSGAYKDILCGVLGWDDVYGYDELMLVNDSFFGFFYPLQDMFSLMDRQDCDFWGITGQIKGQLWGTTYRFDAHVHSYFLIFREKVMKSRVFRDFWEAYEYPASFSEAVVNYEIGINAWLEQHGFRGKSLVDVFGVSLKENEVSYYTMAFRLVKDYKIPIMKKKCLLIRNTGFADVLKAVVYLKQESRYTVEWIMEYLDNQFYIPGMGAGACNSLEIFYNSHTDVYIYGAGICGRNLALYFSFKGWKYKGILCTENKEKMEDVMELGEAKFTPKTGVVISVLSPETADEITEYIGVRCIREQLFRISDCDTISLPN